MRKRERKKWDEDAREDERIFPFLSLGTFSSVSSFHHLWPLTTSFLPSCCNPFHHGKFSPSPLLLLLSLPFMVYTQITILVQFSRVTFFHPPSFDFTFAFIFTLLLFPLFLSLIPWLSFPLIFAHLHLFTPSPPSSFFLSLLPLSYSTIKKGDFCRQSLSLPSFISSHQVTQERSFQLFLRKGSFWKKKVGRKGKTFLSRDNFLLPSNSVKKNERKCQYNQIRNILWSESKSECDQSFESR